LFDGGQKEVGLSSPVSTIFFFLCVKLIPVSAQIKRKNKRIFFLIFEEFDADTKRRSTKHTDLFTEKTNSFLVKQLLWTKKKAKAEKTFFLRIIFKLLRRRPCVFRKKKNVFGFIMFQWVT